MSEIDLNGFAAAIYAYEGRPERAHSVRLHDAIEVYLSTVSPLSDGDGWQLVPREPTEAMVDAFVVEMASESVAFDEFSPPIYPAKCYRAMLAAAPPRDEVAHD